jgi:hydrogenase/urease accessory protein HupE
VNLPARLLLALLLTGVSAGSAAHEVRPGYLEIGETAPDVFDVAWKVPARGEYRLSMYVRLPEKCTGTPAPGTFAAGAYVERWQTHCPGGLVGEHIAIEGLNALQTDVLVRLQRFDGTTQTVRLTPEQISFEVLAVPGGWQVARAYFVLGMEHILLGADHLLFVLALLFLVNGAKRLVATVTAFTVAHSITLAAATLGFVHVPPPPVEATIALSVVFVAGEMLHVARGRPSLTVQAPWIVAFVFGLLHGCGFAGALRQIGLPQADIPLALLFFNVGVEAGQILFILAVVGLLSLVGRFLPLRTPSGPGVWQAEQLVRVPVAYFVGSVATFWVIQRVVGFWA